MKKKYYFAIKKPNINKVVLNDDDIYFKYDSYNNLTEEEKQNNLLPYEYYLNIEY